MSASAKRAREGESGTQNARGGRRKRDEHTSYGVQRDGEFGRARVEIIGRCSRASEFGMELVALRTGAVTSRSPLLALPGKDAIPVGRDVHTQSLATSSFPKSIDSNQDAGQPLSPSASCGERGSLCRSGEASTGLEATRARCPRQLSCRSPTPAVSACPIPLVSQPR
jgi:hypothetical protein